MPQGGSWPQGRARPVMPVPSPTQLLRTGTRVSPFLLSTYGDLPLPKEPLQVPTPGHPLSAHFKVPASLLVHFKVPTSGHSFLITSKSRLQATRFLSSMISLITPAGPHWAIANARRGPSGEIHAREGSRFQPISQMGTLRLPARVLGFAAGPRLWVAQFGSPGRHLLL